MKLRHLFTLAAALLALLPPLSTAATSAVPKFISYQGSVVNASGAKVGTTTPVNRTVIFRVWDNPSSVLAGNLIYSEAQTVTISEGEFSVLVGQGVENTTTTYGYSETNKKLDDLADVFNGSSRYLGVTVAENTSISPTDNEITPRQQIVSTAFAMRAKYAEQIGANGTTTLTTLDNGNVGIGTTNPAALLHVNGTATVGSTLGVTGAATVGGTLGVTGAATVGKTLGVTGAATVGGDLDVTGAATVGGTLGVTGTATVGGDLDVTGDVTGKNLILTKNIFMENDMIIRAENSAGRSATVFKANSSDGKTFLDFAPYGLMIRNSSISPWSTQSVKVSVKDNGNVGIGTDSPQALFHVSVNGGNSLKYGETSSGSAKQLEIYEASGTGHSAKNGTLVLRHGDTDGSSSIVFPSKRNLGSDYGYINFDESGNGGERNILEIGTMNDTDDHVVLMPSGNVGIKTSTPSAALDVNGKVNIGNPTSSGNIEGGKTAQLNVGSQAVRYGHSGYLRSDGASGTNKNASDVDLSIKTDGRILAPEYNVVSDERIKAAIHPSDSQADLVTLLGIEIADYQYIDTNLHGNAWQKKVIAQQVEGVFPQAVQRGVGAVPDIFKNAELADGWVELATDLKVGERVRLITESGDSVEDVLEVRGDAFRTALKTTSDQVFVYGRRVSDFLSVDYDALSMLNLSATQQLKREKDAEIADLKAENVALRRLVAAKDESVEARLIALEQSLSKSSSIETASVKTSETSY